MRNSTVVIALGMFFFTACETPKVEQITKLEEGWSAMNRVAKTVGNITYIFPADVSIQLRDSAIAMNEKSIQENLELIEEKEFTDTIKFEFFHNREDMKLTTGRGVSGLAMPHQDAMYSLLNLSETSPIKHEMMHIISIKKWRYPNRSMVWMNEGLATYSGKICGKDNFGEVYYYMLQNNHLETMERLTSDFYATEEVVGYTQSAYITKYLSETYSWQKVKELWMEGFSQFETVFEKPYVEVEKEMHKKLAAQFPKGVELNWEEFQKGCPSY